MLPKSQLVHKIQFTICVTSIKIEIRFPCKLQIGLKLGKQETTLKEEVELKGGSATFTQPLNSETYLAYDTNHKRYIDKKGTLTIYVVSTRGKNVAGIFPIELGYVMNRGDQEQSFFNQKLERCPDKDATINVKVKGNLIEELPEANLSLIGDISINPPLPPMSGRSTIGLTLNSEIQKMDSKFLSSPRIQSSLTSTLSNKKIQRSFNDKSIKKSFVDQIIPTSQRILADSYSTEIKKTSSKQEYSSTTTTINETFKLKSKIDELENQVDLLKKEVLEKKKYQNEIEALNYKISELQKVISSNRLEIESLTKEKKRDYNDSNNRIEELEKQNVTFQKRSDAKNTFYKEEIEKYNVKLLAAETEKQELGGEITKLKDEIFDLTRKVNVWKDKERVWNDEKGKYNRKVQELKKQVLEKQSTVDTSSKDIVYEKLKQTISNNELEKLSLVEELERVKIQVVNESIFRVKYQEQLKEKGGVIQQKIQTQNLLTEQKQKRDQQNWRFKKDLQQKNQQIQDLTSRLLQLTSKTKQDTTRHTQQHKHLQSQLTTSHSQLLTLQSQNTTLLSTLQQTQRQLNESTRQTQHLTTTIKELQSSLQHLQKTNKSYQQQTRIQTAEIARLTNIISDLESQYSLQTQTKRSNQLQHKTIIDKLEHQNKQLQADLLASQEGLFSLQGQLGQMEYGYQEQMEKKDRMIREKEVEIGKLFEEETRLQMLNVQLEAKEGELKEWGRVKEAELVKERAAVEGLRRVNGMLEESENGLKNMLNETKSLLEQKQSQYDTLLSSNKILDTLLQTTRTQYQTYKENISQHIHTLLKSLVTKSKTLSAPESLPLPSLLPEGLLKLQTDVITKVKNCYEELQVLTQKLLTKEMESINLEQNSNLQVQTLQIELGQIRKQFQLSKEEGVMLGESLESTRAGLLGQNEELKRQMREMEVRFAEELAGKLRGRTTTHEAQTLKLQQQWATQKLTLQTQITTLSSQHTTLLKQLQDQVNEANIFNLKNYELSETIQELEQKLITAENKEGLLESDKNKFIEDIFFLEQELQKVTRLYEGVERNLVLVLEREAILVEENEYLRNEFESGAVGGEAGGKGRFQERERSVLEAHRVNAENGRLNEIVRGLELRLGDKESVIKGLEERVKIVHTNSFVFTGEEQSFVKN